LLNGQRDVLTLEQEAKSRLLEKGFKPDYLHILDPLQLKPTHADAKDFIILVAAFVGATRLIDNLNVHCP